MGFFQGRGIGVFDSAGMTLGLRELEQQLNATRDAHVYWDKVHFLAPVYAGLNQVLLHNICADEDKEESG